MRRPRFIIIDGKPYVWRDILACARLNAPSRGRRNRPCSRSRKTRVQSSIAPPPVAIASRRYSTGQQSEDRDDG